MGIRFRCHHCEHELNVKDFQAGKRGKCPQCQGKFRIPQADAEHSLPIDALSRTAAQSTQAKALASRESASDGVQSQAPTGKQIVASEKSAQSSLSASSADSATDQGKAPPATISESSDAAARSVPDKDAGETDPATSEVQSFSHGDSCVSQGSQVRAGKETVLPPPPAETSTSRRPAAVVEAPHAHWYVRLADGSQYGPATGDLLCQWLDEHRVQPEALVWREGWEQWQAAAVAFGDFYSGMLTPAAQPTGTAGQSDSPRAASGMHPAEISPGASGSTETAGVAATPTAIRDESRLQRRRRRQRNYRLTIAFLSVAAVLLIVTLIIVLVVQQQ